MTTIYVILENNQVRYIGKTKKSDLNERLNQYLEEAKSNPEKYVWLSKYSRNGKKPEIVPVFTYQENEAEYYEKLFISNYRYFSIVRHFNSN